MKKNHKCTAPTALADLFWERVLPEALSDDGFIVRTARPNYWSWSTSASCPLTLWPIFNTVFLSTREKRGRTPKSKDRYSGEFVLVSVGSQPKPWSMGSVLLQLGWSSLIQWKHRSIVEAQEEGRWTREGNIIHKGLPQLLGFLCLTACTQTRILRHLNESMPFKRHETCPRYLLILQANLPKQTAPVLNFP